MEIKIAKSKIKNILKNVTDSNFEINLIFADVLNISQTKLFLTNEISNENFNKILKIAKKRANGKPLQHLLTSWQFYNVNLKLNNKVFIPRPETEMLVEFALQFKNNKLHIIDLCTGSGCISAAIAKNNSYAKIKAVDLSNHAISCARVNTSQFKKRIQLIHENVLNQKLAKNFKSWADLIVCNPPYLTQNDMENLQLEIKSEPKLALFGGNDGLIFYKKICKLWKTAIKNLGWIAFEIGCNQKNDVEIILKQNGFINIKTTNDHSGQSRLTVAQKVDFEGD